MTAATDSPPPLAGERRRLALAALALLIVLATLLAYEPLRANGFVHYDDDVYLTDNPIVQRGLTWEGVRWAFTTGHAANWHPLTWLSHMLDCQLWGLDPTPHHLTGLALHVLCALGLLLLFARTTRGLARAAFVAAVFALHPLHVESVAWASERKDVLSTLLAIVTLHLWVSWTRRPAPLLYGLGLGAFALGLLAKPMLVTLPVVLLLLDAWPLGRWERMELRRGVILLREKLPFLALSLASSVVTFLVQRQGGAVSSAEEVALGARLANALVGYVLYVWQALWPLELAFFYPRPLEGWSSWQVLLAAAALIAATWACLSRRRTAPYLAVGWLWYLSMLVPVIGVVQVGMQARADRYMYLPLVGLSIVVAWGVPDLLSGRRRARTGLACASLLALACAVALTRRQVAVWRDDLALFGHAWTATRDNHVAALNLSAALLQLGRDEEALELQRDALRIYEARQERILSTNPDDAEAHFRLGRSMVSSGRVREGLAHLDQAQRLEPTRARSLVEMGNTLSAIGRVDEAVECFRRAREIEPENARAHGGLAVTLAARGGNAEALACFRRALELDPSWNGLRVMLAQVLLRSGDRAGAIEQLEVVLGRDPDDARAAGLLGQARGDSGPPR